MHIHVKADFLPNPEKRKTKISLSKTIFIKELKKLVEQEIDLEPKLQRLYYRGKELHDEERLVNYRVVMDDVITVFKKQIVEEPREKTSARTKENKVNESNKENEHNKNMVDATSKYYKVGDPVDFRLLDNGAWYEAFIMKILKEKDEKNSEEIDEDQLIFRVRSEEYVTIYPFEEDAKFLNIRPRSFYTYKIPELESGMIVLANYNIDKPRARGLWYDFLLKDVKSVDIIGTLMVGEEKLEGINIKFIQELMRIEDPKLVEEQTEKRVLKPRKYPYDCEKCKDSKEKACRHCGCHVCGGKKDRERMLLCDECDLGYHMSCLNPPLEAIPDEDWYCPSCKVDDSEIIRAGEKLRTKKKAKESKRDWGKGMACVGLTKKNELVPKNHVGSIPKVEVGMCWRFRTTVAESGAHRPPVAGIHGQESDCAYSIVLAGGYEDDEDLGYEFYYTGSGGRDLSGNKRCSSQSFDQELTRTNKALALNCNAPFNNKTGSESKDWKKGKPVRVLRKYGKHSKYAPEEGYRYDGLYKVVKYFPQKGQSGFMVWRYFLRRDDPAQAPWEDGAKKYDIIYPPGWNPENEQKDKLGKDKSEKRKRKANSEEKDDLTLSKKKSKNEEYTVESEIKEYIEKDEINKNLWSECLSKVKNGKKEFLEKIEEIFKCIICIELVYNPVTLKCGHNLCKVCLGESFKHCESDVFSCPHCRASLDKKEAMDKISVNEDLNGALRLLFPGYQTH